MRFHGIVPAKKPAVKWAAGAAACFLMVYEALSGQVLYVLLGLVVLLACFYQKEHIVSEEGVDIASTVLGHTSHSLWRWEEVTAIHLDRKKAAPHVQLHFAKDVAIRLFVMTAEDCEAVLALAKRSQPSLVISEEARSK